MHAPSTRQRLVIAITGASGALYGIRLLQILAGVDHVERHLVVSKSARLTITAETGLEMHAVEALADVVHNPGNIGASIASGSFRTHGMLIAPCSIKTASAIACGITTDLISRAADVMLKERRPLLIALRETPLHAGHLETLLKLARLGAIIFPPVPSLYHRPENVDAIIDQSCMRMLDQFNIDTNAAARWGEDDGVPAIGS